MNDKLVGDDSLCRPLPSSGLFYDGEIQEQPLELRTKIWVETLLPRNAIERYRILAFEFPTYDCR